MKKTNIILLLIILVLFVTGITAQNLTPEQIYEKAVGSVLKIYSFDENNRLTGSGSAVVIGDNGVVVTCYHIFNNGFRIEFEKNGIRVKDVFFIGADPEKDILILKIPEGLFPACKTGNSDSVKIGESVFSLGNPEMYDYTFSCGIITSIRDKTNYSRTGLIQFDASISHGSSGGALLNSKGELIGITASSVEKAQNLNFATPINYYINENVVCDNDSVKLNAVYSYCLAYNNYTYKNFYRTKNSLNTYMESFSEDEKAYILACKNYKDNGFYDSALANINYAIRLNPGNKESYLLRGEILCFKNHYTDGIDEINHALELDSNYFEAYSTLFTLYEFRTNEHKNAITCLTRMIELEPSFSFIYLFRSDIYAEIGDTAAAVNDLYLSENKNMDGSYSYSLRADRFSSLGCIDEAIDNYTKAIGMDPSNKSYYFGRAILYSKKSEHDKAICDYLKVLWFDETDANSYNNLGYEYYHTGNYESAVISFNKALSLDKRHFDSYLGLALVNFAQVDIYRCKKCIRKACEIEPRLENGSVALAELEKKGFFWSNDEKEDLHEIFICVGYDTPTESDDDNSAGIALVKSKSISPAKSEKIK